MKKIAVKRIVLCSVTLALLAPPAVIAGNLEPTAAPSDAASAVYKTDDLYNRLQSGTAGTKRSGGFAEPGAGPADGVGKTLDEIMSVAPAADNVYGAAQADVKSGRTFWGLRTDGTWGLTTGTGTIGGGSAYPAPVAKTGQTTCYNAAGGVIDCAGTGQDGEKHKGVTLPTPRFTVNKVGEVPNGTVTDNLTGLVWLTNANCLETVGGIAKGSGSLTWANALTWSNNLASGQCGLSDGSVAGDWRLPNKRELLSLMTDSYQGPALSNTDGTAQWTEGTPFSGVFGWGYYWSSTTLANSPSYAWRVYFYNGFLQYDPKTTSLYVWPVRGGQ